MTVDPKLLKAAREDEEANQKAYEQVKSWAHLGRKTKIPKPGTPELSQEVSFRIFDDDEIIAFKRRLREINPTFITPGGIQATTPEEDEKLFMLYREYVSNATGWTVDKVKELGHKLNTRLFLTIWRESNPTPEEIEAETKFRGHQ